MDEKRPMNLSTVMNKKKKEKISLHLDAAMESLEKIQERRPVQYQPIYQEVIHDLKDISQKISRGP
jgi:hypothetical protein